MLQHAPRARQGTYFSQVGCATLQKSVRTRRGYTCPQSPAQPSASTVVRTVKDAKDPPPTVLRVRVASTYTRMPLVGNVQNQAGSSQVAPVAPNVTARASLATEGRQTTVSLVLQTSS